MALPTDIQTLKEYEYDYILRVLKLTNGNMTQTARLLDVNRRTLYRKLALAGVTVERQIKQAGR